VCRTSDITTPSYFGTGLYNAASLCLAVTSARSLTGIPMRWSARSLATRGLRWCVDAGFGYAVAPAQAGVGRPCRHRPERVDQPRVAPSVARTSRAVAGKVLKNASLHFAGSYCALRIATTLLGASRKAHSKSARTQPREGVSRMAGLRWNSSEPS